MGHLTPDLVLRRTDQVHVFDAKYKAHFAELDEAGWARITDDVRDSHRADMHQVLAYAALFDAPRITTTLVYPLRPSTFSALSARGRDIARAELFHGGRHLTLQLQGLPFGGAHRAALSEEARVGS
jgi:5-methylcytosine-specific restriction endonuclease McrBC regulatory subunit McrC